ncbi:hypothetical protein BDV96DRAFT_337951 [Lophiotrema nucula]|uniref:Uncharacterized protein n=1 Tax=Lophiotrema nucula TaxID=690887 RepID=A0A6A5YG42_9PLEO|nr:hypothetical protein BDV96DRAFT_337951 [Lophiotrema nucula]
MAAATLSSSSKGNVRRCDSDIHDEGSAASSDFELTSYACEVSLYRAETEKRGGKEDKSWVRRTSKLPRLPGILASFRLLKLPIATQFRLWQAPAEQPKIAVHHGRLMVLLHVFVHIVPLGAAMTLIVLNARNYFIGPVFTTSSALQFVAKLHEHAIQISIAEILFTIMRHELVNGFIPLGMLIAPLQQTQVNYLWSMEFWSTLTSYQAHHGWLRRLIYLALIPVLIALSALVGPSSAIGMIPRPTVSRTFEKEIWELGNPYDVVFPNKIEAIHNVTLDSILHEDPQLLNALTESPASKQVIAMTGSLGVSRIMNIWNPARAWIYSSVNHLDSRYRVMNSTATAATPSRIMSGILSDAALLHENPGRMDRVFASSQGLHPVVTMKCCITPNVTDKQSYPTGDTPVQYWAQNGAMLKDLKTRSKLLRDIIAASNASDTNSFFIPPMWYDDLEPGSSSIIGCFMGGENSYLPYFLLNETFQDGQGDALVTRTCTISAYWALSRHTRTWSDDGVAKITTDFTPNNLKDSTPIFPIKLSVKAIKGLQDIRYDSPWPLLPAVFANALAYVNTTTVVIDWSTIESSVDPQEFTSWPTKNSRYDSNGSVTAVTIDLAYSGYGYGSLSVTVILSLTVLGIYCLITTLYLLFLLINGSVSTAWDSAIELILLALRSHNPNILGHTSVGVESISTFRQPVGIRANDEDGLELVFARDEDVDHERYRKVELNKMY